MPDQLEDSVDRASSARLSRLFGLLKEPSSVTSAEPADDILSRLREPAAVADLLTPILPGGRLAAADLVALALGRTPPLDRLRTEFTAARERAIGARASEGRVAAELLYHALGAAALSAHRIALGQRSAADRDALYRHLARCLAGGPFAKLFSAAVGIEASSGSRTPPAGA
jgi:hypothetical protein